MNEIIKRMQNRIMKHQQENGFETIFDFLNEDLIELQEKAKLFAMIDIMPSFPSDEDCINAVKTQVEKLGFTVIKIEK